MELSLREYQALVAKAFRGAGYSWGLAEDAAFAAKRLAEFDLGSGEVVVRLLTAIDGITITECMPDAEWQSTSGTVCPICAGTSIADQSAGDHITVNALLEPLLLAPFLEMVSVSGVGYVIEWSAGRCEITTNAIEASVRDADRDQAGPVNVTVTQHRATEGFAAKRPTTRVLLRPEVQTALEDFAQRVYAPATEESRRAGAGE